MPESKNAIPDPLPGQFLSSLYSNFFKVYIRCGEEEKHLLLQQVLSHIEKLDYTPQVIENANGYPLQFSIPAENNTTYNIKLHHSGGSVTSVYSENSRSVTTSMIFLYNRLLRIEINELAVEDGLRVQHRKVIQSDKELSEEIASQLNKISDEDLRECFFAKCAMFLTVTPEMAKLPKISEEKAAIAEEPIAIKAIIDALPPEKAAFWQDKNPTLKVLIDYANGINKPLMESKGPDTSTISTLIKMGVTQEMIKESDIVAIRKQIIEHVELTSQFGLDA
jgi:hypothetical protein